MQHDAAVEQVVAPPYRHYLTESDELAIINDVWYLRLLYSANFTLPCNLTHLYSSNLVSVDSTATHCNDADCRMQAISYLCELANLTERNNTENVTIAAAASSQLSLTLKLLIMIATVIVSFITVVGNLMVLLSFVIERSLRQATNYFIVSLAVTDVLIGLFSMNFYSLYIALDYKWLLGELICDLWLALDFTVCLASQYTVFFITVDRYCSVKIAAKYRSWRTDGKILAMVLGSWFIPSAIFFTVILGWKSFYGRTRPETACEAEFTYDVWFTLILTIAYYWVTLVVMIALYTEIYRVAAAMSTKSAEKRKQAQLLVSKAETRSHNSDENNETRTSAYDTSAQSTQRICTSLQRPANSDIDEDVSHSRDALAHQHSKRGKHRKKGNKKGVCQNLLSTAKPKQERKIENKAGKALRTITFILGFFVACWTPYHVVILIKRLLHSVHWRYVYLH